MSFGYIYKITNQINGKCYVGQTTKTIKQRYKDHLKTSKTEKSQGYNYPLYRAIRKYGEENFIVEEIEKIVYEDLDAREIYWISYFESYTKGYNQTRGGSGTKLLDLDDAEIIKDYLELKTLTKVAEKNKVCLASVKSILEKNNVEIITEEEHAKEKGYLVDLYTLDNEYIETFETVSAASRWLITEHLVENRTVKSLSTTVKYHIISGTPYKGYIWKSNSYDGKTIQDIKKIKYKDKKIECPICKQLMTKRADKCFECRNKELQEQSLDRLDTIIGRDALKELIRTESFVNISKRFEVSDNTIRKWCKRYKLPFRNREIKEITDTEWLLV